MLELYASERRLQYKLNTKTFLFQQGFKFI